jgi:hypothetical protein
MSVWKPSVLTAAVNKIKPVRTDVLDRVFARKAPQISENFAWDVVSGSETLMKNIKVAAPATVAQLNGKIHVTCTGPRFAEKRLITAEYLNGLRRFGADVQQELLQNEIARNQADMRAKLDRTREFQAVSALKGLVVDSDGNTIVDYSLPGAQKPTLAGRDLWTDDESKPINNLRAWKKAIRDGVGNCDSFFAFVGSTVMEALLNNPNMRELLKYTIGDQVAREGRIAHAAGIDFIEYDFSYLNGSGTRTRALGDSYMILVGVNPDMAAEYYAPPAIIGVEGGVGSGGNASMIYSDSWEERDPSGRWIRVESRPLPVLFKTESIIYAKPV